jgi:hypothetical protein
MMSMMAGLPGATARAGPVAYQVTVFDESPYFLGNSWTTLYGINDSGDIAGIVWDHISGDARAFTLAGAGHVFTDVSVAGARSSEAYAIDDAGTVTGSYRLPAPDPSGFGFGSFVRAPDGTYTLTPGGLADPPSLPLTPTFEVPGAYPGTTAVYGVNAAGQLVGAFGVFLDPVNLRGFVEYGFLAMPTLGLADPTPAPEPATWMPAALGIFAAAGGLLLRPSRRA